MGFDRSKDSKLTYAAIIAALIDEGVGAVDLHESQDRSGALPGRIKPLNHEWVAAGPALPVSFTAGDNLWLHRALMAAEPGEILVGQPDGPEEAGYWGEIMTVAALTRGIAGLVLDGCVRDRSRLIDLDLPVFCTGLSINGTDKFSDGKGSIGDPIKIADVAVERGDLIYGDEDGVVVVPQGAVPTVVAAARTRKRYEREIISRIKAGESTLEIFQLAAQASPRSEGESQADSPAAPSTSSDLGA